MRQYIVEDRVNGLGVEEKARRAEAEDMRPDVLVDDVDVWKGLVDAEGCLTVGVFVLW
jgi:hypothetical protein